MRKKYGHIIWMAMAMLMGMAWSCCSSDDSDEQDVPVTGTPIAFSAKEGEETAVNNGGAGARAYGMTRASSLSDNNVTSFTVWGFKNLEYNEGTDVYGGLQTVFPGYIVKWITNSAATTTSNTNGWEYVNQQTSGDEQTIKYWDWAAKAYRFYAVTGNKTTDYTNYAESGTYGGSYETVSFTMTADASSTEDIAATPYFSRLWFSTGSEALYPTRLFGKPVVLEFLKPYSRVRFLFTYSYEAEGIKLKNPSFKPTDGTKIARKGTFKVTYPLTGTATSESYTVTNIDHSAGLDEFDKEYIPEGGVEREVWYTVLPIDPSTPQGSYTLTVDVNGSTKSCVVPAQYMQWKPGFSYTYIFKITDSGGVEIDLVQAAFTPWEERSSDDYEVYNW